MANYYVEYERDGLDKWCVMQAESGTVEQDKKDIAYTVKMYGGSVLCIEKMIDMDSFGRV